MQNTLFGVFDDLLRTRLEGAIASGTYDVGVEIVTAESLRMRPIASLNAMPCRKPAFAILASARPLHRPPMHARIPEISNNGAPDAAPP